MTFLGTFGTYLDFEVQVLTIFNDFVCFQFILSGLVRVSSYCKLI